MVNRSRFYPGRREVLASLSQVIDALADLECDMGEPDRPSGGGRGIVPNRGDREVVVVPRG